MGGIVSVVCCEKSELFHSGADQPLTPYLGTPSFQENYLAFDLVLEHRLFHLRLRTDGPMSFDVFSESFP